ncbi:MAG: UvrD-helicase domain-containing protein [Solirubrobacterales bacterium]
MSPAREPTREQREAIASRGRDVLLEAGAGTGKTGVLVDRYCELVIEDGLGPDQILAFTFTDKAAAQLRDRVRRELRRRTSADTEQAELLAELVTSFGAAPITTIHGFCRRLLASHPVAAGIDPNFQVLDASETARAARSAFDAALQEFLAGGDPEREATVAAYRIDGLREMVIDVHEELRSRGHAEPRLAPAPVGDMAAAMAALEATAAAALGAKGEKEEQRRRLEAAIELCAGRRDAAPSLDELDALWLDPKLKGARGECAKALRAATARAAEAGEGAVAYDHVNELLGLYDRHFGAVKSARSGLDFEDLQLEAVRLLTETEIGEAYRDRFAHLMVDEFQDTNRLQLSLIEALRGPETELFLVGDEFQSIYGFRHADLEVFRAQRDEFRDSARARVLPLSGNFRSRPGIVAAANVIGASMLDGHNPLSVGVAPEGEAPPGGGGAVELLLTDRNGWDAEGIELELPVDDRTPKESVAEARFLAARLRELTESGAVEPGDIVVLLRAFTHVDAFEEAFVRAGLRPYVVGGRGYWSQQQVEDVRCLLSVIANPLDDEPLLGALASPACGVLPDTLWILRRAAGPKSSLWPALEHAVGAWEPELEEPQWLGQIPDPDLRRLQDFHARVNDLRAEGPRLSLEELIERAVSDTGYDLAILLRGPGALRLANLRKLMRMAREFEANEGRDLRGFLDFVAFRTTEDDEPIAATEAEDHNGVRLMTIHTAKGLEFPVVAVAGLGRNLRPGGRDPDLNLGRGAGGDARVGMRLARLGARSVNLYERKALIEEGTAFDSAEERRLFYVAATRARERLLLSGVPPARPPDELAPTTPVSEHLIRAFGVQDRESDSEVELPAAAAAPGLGLDFTACTVQVRVNRPSPERAAELTRAASAERPPPAASGASPPIVEAGSPVTPRRPLSYSALADYERCGYRFYNQHVLGLAAVSPGDGSSAGRAGRSLGNAVHQLLEWSASRRWIEPPAPVVKRVVAAQGLDPDAEAQRALTMVRGWIDSPLLEELKGTGLSVDSEVPFLLELGGSILRGKIDLLARPSRGVPTVVDFKTDRLDGTEPGEHAGRYELQRDLYALATAEATGAEAIRVAYVFLERPTEPVIEELGRDAIRSARAGLEGIIVALAEGRFEVTSTPDWPLCHDCPARRRLCSNPAPPPA